MVRKAGRRFGTSLCAMMSHREQRRTDLAAGVHGPIVSQVWRQPYLLHAQHWDRLVLHEESLTKMEQSNARTKT
jgi:hypothetical protein